jgi:hypothetical protein
VIGTGGGARRGGASHEVGEVRVTRCLNHTLALLSLTMFSDYGAIRAWKSLDWDVLDRLSARGWIHDPKGKAKSVVFTPEGEAYARALAERYFGPRE